MASRAVTGKVSIQIQSDLKNNLNNTGKVATSQVGSQSFISDNFRTSGVKSGQKNRVWENTEISIPNGTNVEINLSSFAGWDIGGGDGNDAVGLDLIFQEIVLIAIKNTSTEDGTAVGGPFLEVEPALASGWTAIGSHTVASGGALAGGGCIVKYNPGEAGFDVQPGTAERIKLTANGGDVTAWVYIDGRSDDDESSSSSSASSASSSSSSVSSSSVSSSISSSLSSSSTS